MNRDDSSTLEEVIRNSGEGALIDDYHSPSKALPWIRGKLEEVMREAKTRGRDRSVLLSDDALKTEYGKNPLKLKSLFQAVRTDPTPGMLLMAWRVIQGMEIKELAVEYRARLGEFRMAVTLESPYDGGEEEVYESSSIRDFRLLRHLGVFEVNGVQAMMGFYPLKTLDPTRTAT